MSSNVRCYLPHEEYLVTRNTIQGEFLLLPTDAVNHILAYSLGLAQVANRVELHSFCFQANHIHKTLADPFLEMSDFMRDFARNSALALNRHHGRQGALWEPGSFHATILGTSEKILDRTSYVVTNPVKDGLVSAVSEWPGLVSTNFTTASVRKIRWVKGVRWSEGRRSKYVRIERPDPEAPRAYFTKSRPEEVEIELTAPRAFWGDPRAFWRECERRARETERAVQELFRREGRRFMGAERILSQSPRKRPSRGLPGSTSRRLFVTACTKELRKRIEARIASFDERYREAWERFCGGERGVKFPNGTFEMRRRYGVKIARPTSGDALVVTKLDSLRI